MFEYQIVYPICSSCLLYLLSFICIYIYIVYLLLFLDDSLLAERLDECRMDAAKNDDIKDEEAEIIENISESALAETCVLVEEEEDMLLHFINQGNVKHKSYKVSSNSLSSPFL